MKRFALFLVLPLFASCARFHTKQVDQRGTNDTITTSISAWTFFDSKSALTAFKATQTEKTQSASVGALTQEASGSNAVSIVESIVGAAVRSAVRAAIPTPTPPLPP